MARTPRSNIFYWGKLMKLADWNRLGRVAWLPVLPYLLCWFGSGLNLLVCTVNHGYMPVAISIMQHGATYGDVLDPQHRMWQHTDHLKFLADWIQVPGLGELSIGDLFIDFGEWINGYFWNLLCLVFGYLWCFYSPFHKNETKPVGTARS